MTGGGLTGGGQGGGGGGSTDSGVDAGTDAGMDAGAEDAGVAVDAGVFFEFAPADGRGMTAACACTVPTGAKGEALTFTRASSGTCLKGDPSAIHNGDLVTCSTNQPRVMSGDATPVLGLLIESARTNSAIQSSAFDDAAWIKPAPAPTITANFAVAPDGTMTADRFQTTVAASSCAVQTIPGVPGPATHVGTVFLKAVTGSPQVYCYLYQRNGSPSASTPVTLNTSTWTRCQVTLTTNATANVSIGVGYDTGIGQTAVAADFLAWGAQVELGATYPSSYIPTTTAAVERAEDSAYATVAAFQPRSLGAVGTVDHLLPRSAGLLAAFQDATHHVWMSQGAEVGSVDQYLQCAWKTAVDSLANSSVFLPLTYGGAIGLRCHYDGTNGVVSIHGYQSATALSFTPPASVTRVYLGSLDAAGNPWDGVVKRVCADPRSDRCGAPYGVGNDVVMLGDSITRSDLSAPTRLPLALASAKRRVVINAGVTGDTASLCRARFDASISGEAYGALVLLCSVNSINYGLTAAEVWTDLQSIAEKARLAGIKVVLVKTTPWATYSGWTAGKQAETDALWTTMQSYCSTYPASVACVSTDSLGSGIPLALKASSDSGDHLHLSAAGSGALASLIAAALP